MSKATKQLTNKDLQKAAIEHSERKNKRWMGESRLYGTK